MSTSDALPQGVPYAVGELLMQALRDAPDLSGVTLLDNPVRASDISEGERVIFFEDVSDGPAEQGEQIKRVYRFNVGVINRTEAARLGVHTDYRVAKRVLDEALPTIKEVVVANFLREGEIAFRLENIDVGGGLVLATFTLGYRDPSFRRVG
jgi:hypothetical protein